MNALGALFVISVNMLIWEPLSYLPSVRTLRADQNAQRSGQPPRLRLLQVSAKGSRAELLGGSIIAEPTIGLCINCQQSKTSMILIRTSRTVSAS